MIKFYCGLIFYFVLLSMSPATAQREGNIWCFGNGAGLDFNSGSPVFFPGVAMNQWEGVSSIANAAGQLLFYSDGITVWNRNHAIMPNGTGLSGGMSSTQSALFIKQPGANPFYYLFVAPQSASLNPLTYSIIDTTLLGGLGDVTMKNVTVYPNCDERVTACMHQNGMDVWILTTTTMGDTIVSFILSSTGLSGPVAASYNGPSGYNQLGYMKASHDGQHIAIAYYGGMGPYELYDFDISTGVASNKITLDSTAYANAYGIEFSPDNTKLYGAGHGAGYTVFQWDITSGIESVIKSTATLVATASHGYAAALQLAPDGKIYLSQWTSSYLGRFDNPNGAGVACSYDDNAVMLPSGTTNGGLPNLRSGIFYQSMPIALFSAPNDICPGTCTNFNNLSINGTSYQWSFPGANPSASTDVAPQNICYNTPGNYSVTLIASNANGSDTITLNNYITVFPYPAPQGIIQNGDSLIANSGAISYQWYYNGILIPGATDYFYLAPQSGNYNVVATDANGCEVEAVIFDVIASVFSRVDNSEIAISPNPATSHLDIRINEKAGNPMRLKIFNTLGEIVIQNTFVPGVHSTESVDISKLADGFYLVELGGTEKCFRTNFIKD